MSSTIYHFATQVWEQTETGWKSGGYVLADGELAEMVLDEYRPGPVLKTDERGRAVELLLITEEP